MKSSPLPKAHSPKTVSLFHQENHDMRIPFHPLTLADKDLIQQRVLHTECRNCDLNFMNLISWRFLYDTEVADYNGWLVFRFKADGHPAYLAPVGNGDWRSSVQEILEDAYQNGNPFLMLGVCENSLAQLENALPEYFYATADRSYTDYIYRREALATLAGKKLQSKRNFANRFARNYANYEFLPLTEDLIPECIELDRKWEELKTEENEAGRYTYEAERRSLLTVFENWNALGGRGGVIRVNGKIVAFTYGAPINYDTFGICVEKADTSYEGSFAIINRDFARSLPEQYTLLNREEDLGIEGLRKAKLSYQPEILLQKYTVMTKHPFSKD